MPRPQPERHGMAWPEIVGFILLGSAIGIISGMLGIGGGILVIPALIFLFSFTHKQAVAADEEYRRRVQRAMAPDYEI
jgi:hypothetical protein